MPTNLRFDPLVADTTATFFSLDDDDRAKLATMPGTLERLEGALHFAYGLSTPEGHHRERLAGSFFRAALAEYVSLDEIARIERPTPRFSILATDLPLPHILKALRNLQIHLRTTPLRADRMWLHLRLVKGEQPVEVARWCVADLTADHLMELDAFTGANPKYTREQAGKLVAWFHAAQSLFGFPDLVWRAVRDALDRLSAP